MRSKMGHSVVPQRCLPSRVANALAAQHGGHVQRERLFNAVLLAVPR